MQKLTNSKNNISKGRIISKTLQYLVQDVTEFTILNSTQLLFILLLIYNPCPLDVALGPWFIVILTTICSFVSSFVRNYLFD